MSKEEGENLAKDLDTLFMEVSAKSSLNVGSIFQVIAGFLPGNESHRMHIYEDNRNFSLKIFQSKSLFFNRIECDRRTS